MVHHSSTINTQLKTWQTTLPTTSAVRTRPKPLPATWLTPLTAPSNLAPSNSPVKRLTWPAAGTVRTLTLRVQPLPAVQLLGHCVGCGTIAVGATQAHDQLGLQWPPAQVVGQTKALDNK
jgi:hypothetical protein